MSIGPIPLCMKCEHLKKEVFNYHCIAFPEGIPEEIFVGGFNHRNEYSGDGGIRFEPKEEDK